MLGFSNLVIAYFLLCRVGDFDWRSTAQAAAAGGGALLMGLMLARHFGKFHGYRSAPLRGCSSRFAAALLKAPRANEML